MARLSGINTKQFIKFLQSQGFQKVRQTGSHIIMHKDGIGRSLVIPKNDKEVSIGVVKNILKTLEITDADFIKAMQNPKKSKPSG